MPDGQVPLPPVSTTAVGVAAIRASESAQPEPWFVDPLAPAFVRAANTFWTVDRAAPRDRGRVGSVIFWVRVRTRFLDAIVADACRDGCRQFVVLGAGLDARAFRLPLPPDARWFEVDLAGVLEFKERVVRENGFAPACERIVVPTDLAAGWTADLDRSGFDRTVRTTWLAEGLLAYLTEDTREAVIDQVSDRSVTGSRFGLTLAGADRASARRRDPDALPSEPGDYVGLWQSDPPPDARTWLGDRGWSVEQHDAVERAASYGLEVPSSREPRARARLVDATRV
jgi:methyltransferase (TIGR00027 family)